VAEAGRIGGKVVAKKRGPEFYKKLQGMRKRRRGGQAKKNRGEVKRTMPMLTIKCPNTGKPVITGISMDKQSFATATLTDNSVSCPHCGQAHVWTKKDVLPLAD
jgi:endogenous inhibitor of DNA gyrase (YacG/DUF329 family)